MHLNALSSTEPSQYFNSEVHIVKCAHMNEQGKQYSEFVASKPDIESQKLRKSQVTSNQLTI